MAGHVDHGKSTLVRALTGMEPDRWAEERRRGMTIDLGYAWTTLPTGETLGFVDVPGHERFIGNMLAGLGPAPAVLVVVAADEGWRRQSAEHLAAIDALGLRHGLLAVTRSDLADPGPVTREALDHVAASSLGRVEAVAVSGATGQGLDGLRAALSRLVGRLPAAQPEGRVRLWVDRCFTIRGSGTVVTGTLAAGTLVVGDELELRGRRVRVRGLQSLGQPYDRVSAVARVAVNLRSVPREEVHRGDALLTPGAWRPVSTLDARLSADPGRLPAELVLHVGSAGVPVHVRPLGGDVARLSLHQPLPLQGGDRAILRDPGRHAVAAGVRVLDVDPPALVRRGAAAQRASALAAVSDRPDLVTEVGRRGAVRLADLATLGVEVSPRHTADAGDLRREGDCLVARDTWQAWLTRLVEAVDEHAAATPLDPAMPEESARRAAGVPDARLIAPLATAAGLRAEGGRVSRPGTTASLGAAEEALAELENRLRATPFAAPERPELATWGWGTRQLAAAENAGRVLRLDDDVVLLPTGPALAMRVLSGLPQPFTTSEARQALDTTRRVAIPLLEHLDRRGWTRRLDAGHREVVR